MIKVLISGFEPFGGERVNPSEILCREPKLLHELVRAHLSSSASGSSHVKFEIQSVLLPVSYARAFAPLQNKLDQFNPDIVIAIGQAAGRSKLNLEWTAVNLVDSSQADNDGAVVEDQPIDPSVKASWGLKASWPVKTLVDELNRAQIPAECSFSAGTYVCNLVFYNLLKNSPQRICGFLHLPLMTEQSPDSSRPTLAVEIMQRGLATIIARLIDIRSKR